MNNYTFNYDKKIKTYLLIYMITGLLSSLITYITMSSSNLGSQYSYTSITDIFGGGYFVLLGFSLIMGLFMYYLYYMSVSFKCSFQLGFLKYGTLGLKKIEYKKIDSISFDGHILLHSGDKKIRIRVLNFEKNEDMYRELLNDIKENCDIDFSVDDAMKQLSYVNNFEFAEEGKALRLNGWLFVLFVYSIIYTALMGLYLLPTILISLVAFEWWGLILPFILIAFFVLSLMVTIFIGKRNKKALRLMKGIIIAFFAIIIIGYIFAAFMTMSTIMIPLLSYTFIVVSYFSIMLIVIRALKISKRVKHTFVYNKMQPVQKYDRSIDPGFKLFAWEPASIYGVISWIIAPILGVVVFIYIIIVAFTSSMMF